MQRRFFLVAKPKGTPFHPARQLLAQKTLTRLRLRGSGFT